VVPLAVWPVAQTSAQYQRAGRYLPECAEHPAKMLPELARRIITEYSNPGALVVDVMAGTGTTVVEAAALARRAIGVELEPRWADVARANLDHVLDPDHRPLAEIRIGDARRLDHLLGDLAGTVDLVCTSPPYACDVGNMDKANWGAGGDLCPSDARNYSIDRSNLGHARGAAYEAAMADIYAGCYELVRPGGVLVTVTKHTRRHGRTLDLAGLTSTLVRRAGFSYLARVVALHAAVRDGDLVARPSFWQTTQVRKARTRGEPAHLVVHEDVLAFRKVTADAH
jgi:DNA modification methylase